MIIFREYDKEKRLDRIWYNSSNVVYSECEDKLDDYKTLRVVFKGGATYEYKKVDVNDYVMFAHGSIDGSNGKALNKFIKPKYEFEKKENTNIKELLEEMEALQEIRIKKQEENGESNSSDTSENME